MPAMIKPGTPKSMGRPGGGGAAPLAVTISGSGSLWELTCPQKIIGENIIITDERILFRKCLLIIVRNVLQQF